MPQILAMGSVPTNATSATVTWLITAISYTQESYYVIYGVASDSLVTNSDTVQSTINITDTNLAYSITLMELHPFTLYYYKVVATNSYSTTESLMDSFHTSEAGMDDFSTLNMYACFIE